MTFEHGHALIVGVGSSDLPETIRDARAIAELLGDQDICAYPKEQVTLLTGRDATRANILAALKKLSNTDESATVVVYFSGHGAQVKALEGEQYYLLLNDFDDDRPDLERAAISDQEFNGALDQIKSKKRLLLLDCCHAAGIQPAHVKSRAPKNKSLVFTKSIMPIEARKKLDQGAGQILIASSRASEVSWGGEPYSAFTQSLLQALRGAGTSREDGYVRAIDLALHAREQIPQLTGYVQHPICDFSGADNFLVSHYAGGQRHLKEMPTSLKNWQIIRHGAVAPQPAEVESPVTYRNFVKFAKAIHRSLVRELTASGVPDMYIPHDFDTTYPYWDGWYAFIFTPRSPLNEPFEPEDAPLYFALRINPQEGKSATRAADAYAYCIVEQGGLINWKKDYKVELRRKLMRRLNAEAERADRKLLPASFVEGAIWFECGQKRIAALDTAAADLVGTWFLKQIPAFEDGVWRFLSRPKRRRASSALQVKETSSGN